MLIRLCAVCGHFNLDLHARIGQARLDHGRGRPHIAQILLEHRPTGLEILAPRQYVAHAHDIDHRRTSLRKRGRDVAHRLLALSDHVIGNCHRSVVEAGRAGNENPISIDDGA
jgi:hypothetical protein